MSRNVKRPTPQSFGESKMSTRYIMKLNDVNTLAADLFSALSQISHLFTEPTSYISSLLIFPIDLEKLMGYDTPTKSTELIKLGNHLMTTYAYNMYSGTVPPLNMGDFTISRYFNNFLDFSPYTKIELYMPYIGVEPLDVDAVMGKNCHLRYVVDLHSGEVTANLSVGDGSSETIVFSRTGQIGKNVQVAGGGSADIARGILNVGKIALDTYAATGSKSSTAIAAAGAIVDAPKSSPQKITSQGANNAFYAPQFAYLIYTRPNIARPATYNGLYGRPSEKTATLGSLTGYTVVDRVHVEGDDFAGGTQTEIDQIEQLLKNGVIL